MEYIAYYLRENKGSRLPTRILFLDTETRSTLVGDIELHHMALGWTWYIELTRQGAQKREEWRYWEDPRGLCEYIESLTAKGKTLYVIGSHIVFDMWASGIPEFLTSRGWTARILYGRGPITVISVERGGAVIKFLSLQNFIPGSVREWGELLGVPKMEVDFRKASKEELKRYCRRDVEITGMMFLRYLSFLRRYDLGSFGPTISSQALHAFKHRFMSHKILHYDREDYTEFCRQGFFGGRNECFYIGELPEGRYYLLDVNSMYPYVMKEYRYPTVFRQFVGECDPEYIRRALSSKCVMAEVYLETEEPAYPYRMGKYLIFPVGKFWTVLCSGALKYAFRKGHIRAVRRAILWDSEYIFTRYVEFFYSLKKRYTESKNRVFREIAKNFLNHLYGKFAEERDRVIVDDKDDTGEMWRMDIIFPDDDTEGVEWVGFGRHVITKGKVESPQAVVPIAAHVTDYGRMYLWKLIRFAGWGNVYYCDTDSILVNEKGYHLLESFIHPTVLGALSVREEGRHVKIWGAKDYEFEGHKRIKGIREDAVPLSPDRFKQREFPSLAALLRLGIPSGYPVRTVEKKLTRRYVKGEVQSDGWVRPVRLQEAISGPP